MAARSGTTDVSPSLTDMASDNRNSPPYCSLRKYEEGLEICQEDLTTYLDDPVTFEEDINEVNQRIAVLEKLRKSASCIVANCPYHLSAKHFRSG